GVKGRAQYGLGPSGEVCARRSTVGQGVDVTRGLAPMVRDLAVRTPDSRERSADTWRALAICPVVLGHWFVIAVTHQDGVLSGYNALDVLTWVDPVTWLFQVMPIFFLVGGYASSASMASHRRGGDGIGWVLRRTDRLLRPTT